VKDEGRKIALILPDRRYLRWLVVPGFLLLGALVTLGHCSGSGRSAPRTVAEAVQHYAPEVEPRLSRQFLRAGVAYPPGDLTLLAFKEEKRLEVWGRRAGDWVRVLSYPVLAASGGAGPKLREGDRQVPEGFYRIEGLNPNSRFHLSLKIDYPNAFDRARAHEEGRTHPGSDIFIHGRAVSAGCLAIGDEAIEELFVLVSRSGAQNVAVLILPRDLRVHGDPPVAGMPGWLPNLYADLRAGLQAFPGDDSRAETP